MAAQTDDQLAVKATSRIDAFSDGVFAIVITLLVFNLHVPSPSDADQVGLLALLARDWVSYLALFTSFAVIGIMWVNHHQMFTFVCEADNSLKYINLALLFGIAVVPFTTQLVQNYVGHRDGAIASVIYSLNAVFNAACFILFWRHLQRHPELLMTRKATRHMEIITQSGRWGMPGYLLALVLSFFSVPLSLLIHILLAVYFALPNRQAQAEAERLMKELDALT